MPPRLYDDTDLDWHPVLVVRVDPMMRWTRVATRTTKTYAKTAVHVAHGPDARLGFDLPGYWRLGDLHPVPFANFDEPDVELLGTLDDSTWSRVVAALAAGLS
jgi:hypothetical protein